MLILDADGRPYRDVWDWWRKNELRILENNLAFARKVVPTLYGPDDKPLSLPVSGVGWPDAFKPEPVIPDKPLSLPVSGVGDTITVRLPKRFATP